MTLLVCADPRVADGLAAAIGTPTRLERLGELRRLLPAHPHDVVVLGPDVDLGAAAEYATEQRLADPDVGVVLVRPRIDTPVLGLALRSGIRDVVTVGDLQRLREACDASAELTARVRTARSGGATGRAALGRVVSVLGGKGGVGTTTVAVSTAVLLAERGLRVCVLDLDLAFGDVAMALRLFPERTLANAVGMGDTLDVAGVHALTMRHGSGLHALLSPTTPSVAEHIPARLVTRLLEIARELYDVIVVDTPSAFTDPVLTALDVSDEVLLVATPDVAAAKNHKLVEQTLDALGVPAERRRLVLNRHGADSGLTDKDLEAVLGRRAALRVPVAPAVAAAANRGTPVSAYQPHDPAVRALRAVADVVAGAPATSHRNSSAPASAFRSVLRRRVATS